MERLGLSLALSASGVSAGEVSGNAALVYWQAFEGLKDVTGEEYQRIMDAAVDEPMDAKYMTLVESSEHALKLMHRASRRTYCDWGVDFREDGAEAVLPHLALARGLGRVGLLRARKYFIAGQHQLGVDDVLAVMAMARHAGRDRSLVGLLVNQGIERMAIELMSAYLPRLSKSDLNLLESGLSRLPARNSFANCMATEAEFVVWLKRRVAATSNDTELRSLAMVLGLDSPEDEFFTKSGGRDSIVADADRLFDSYQALPGIVDRPLSLQESPFDEIIEQATQNSLGAIFFPALDKAWHSHRRHMCYDGMFRAGLSVVLRGEETLKSHTDPTDGRTFRMQASPGAFQLKSQFLDQPGSTNPVCLAFGKSQASIRN